MTEPRNVTPIVFFGDFVSTKVPEQNGQQTDFRPRILPANAPESTRPQEETRDADPKASHVIEPASGLQEDSMTTVTQTPSEVQTNSQSENSETLASVAKVNQGEANPLISLGEIGLPAGE